MKAQLFRNHISVRPSPVHGYGVFADKNIKMGEVVEECYVLITSGTDDVLKNYYFNAEGESSLFFGLGSIYNHATDHNATYDIDMKTSVATITALKPINEGEEIFISYGEDWFTHRGWKVKSYNVWRRLLDPRHSVIMRGLLACGLIVGLVHYIKM